MSKGGDVERIVAHVDKNHLLVILGEERRHAVAEAVLDYDYGAVFGVLVCDFGVGVVAVDEDRVLVVVRVVLAEEHRILRLLLVSVADKHADIIPGVFRVVPDLHRVGLIEPESAL